jgi:hypothetical protein
MPSLAFAQTPVLNPTTVTFTAPADHTTNVASYVVEVNRVTGTPLGIAASADIGKPTPVGTDITSSVLTTLLPTLPSCASAADGCYTVTILAKNGFGSTRSPASVPFTKGGPPAAPGIPVPK